MRTRSGRFVHKSSGFPGRDYYDKETVKLFKVILAGYAYDPGSSDLDDEQPIHVSMTLGDYRRIQRLVRNV